MNIGLEMESGGLLAEAITPAIEIMREQLGVSFRKCSTPDLTWTAASDSSGPTIAFERVDHSGIVNRHLLSRPNVRLAKMYQLPGNLNNAPTVDSGRLFLGEIDPEAARKPRRAMLSECELSRLAVSPANFLHYRKLDLPCSLFKDGYMDWNERDVDIFFAGTVEYGESPASKLVARHRNKALEDVRKLSKRYRTYAEPGRVLGRKEYYQMMERSKLVVCPWGMGEACYRDYEALIAGCRIIKPRAGYHILSSCGLYSGDHEPVAHSAPMDMLSGLPLDDLLHQPPASDIGRVLLQMHSPTWLAGKLFDLSMEIIGGAA
jgi:hypothetical protein